MKGNYRVKSHKRFNRQTHSLVKSFLPTFSALSFLDFFEMKAFIRFIGWRQKENWYDTARILHANEML